MKKRHYIILLLLVARCALPAAAQTNMGFEQTDYIKIAGITTDAQIAPLTASQKQTTMVYLDGLGRAIQSIANQGSPLGHDLVQPVAYDNLGRQTTAYLPYADESANPTGSYRPNAISTDQPAFYNNTSQYLIATDAAPYTQKVFENSPLQRLTQAGMVGTGYQPGVSGNYTKAVLYRPNSNASDGNILQWNVDGTYTASTYYADNTLSVTDAKDEDNVETLTFTDYAGHMILKRQILSTGNLDTYYIYNKAGLIYYIVPPKATGLLAANSYNLSTAPLSNLVFKFVYDGMGRVTQKTVPAKGVMYIVYDPINRPVLLQDANMRASNQWNYIKYDVKGRAISQGIYTDATHTSLSAMQTYVSGLNYSSNWYETRSNTGTTTGYYTNNAFPNTNITPLAYAYFDNYDLLSTGSAQYSYVSQSLPNEETATAAQVKGMPTMVWKTTVGSGLSGIWLLQVTFYDKRGNPIQTQSNNHLYYTGSTAITDYKTNVPDFTGVVQTSKVSKTSASGTTTTILTNFTYDANYRVSTISQAYNGGTATTVAAYSYNEIGQLIAKNLGQVSTSSIPSNLTLTTYSATTATASNNIYLNPTFSVTAGNNFNAYISTNYLQTVDMRYNIRGQLLTINNSKLSYDGGITNNDSNDLFGMQMIYDQTDANLGNTAYHDGKLSAVKWMSKDASNNYSWERSYSFSYDQINRYTGETYVERATTSTGSFNNNVDGFDENGITYDAGGNILTLNRNSSTQGTNTHIQIDNLAYTYSTTNPYQLVAVADGSGSNYTTAGFRNLTGSTGNYTYDANGNLTADPYKGLTIAYDVLNRTDKITVTTGSGQYINYTYDATGTLIRKQAYNGGSLQTTTDYIEGFVYVNSTLSYFPMPEGRVLNNSGTLKQEFIITDQQGNARISFQDNGSGVAVVKQENSYYGFGLIMPNSPVALPTTPNKQLYNGGSEWQNDYSNLPDYYQTFNRNYDAALGRFVGVDGDAESAESMTSYQYSGNNPIMYNDPLGDLVNPDKGIISSPPPPPNGGSNYGDDGSLIGGGGSSDPADFIGRNVSNQNPIMGNDDPIGAWGDAVTRSAVRQTNIEIEGLYYADPAGYWAYYKATNGTLGGQQIYKAGKDHISVAEQIANLVNNGGELYVSPTGGLAFTPVTPVSFSLPGNLPRYRPDTQQGNTCEFCTAAEIWDYWTGESLTGLNFLRNFAVLQGGTPQDIDANYNSFFLTGMGLEILFPSYFYYTNLDNTGNVIQALLDGYPVAASISAHAVFVTGFYTTGSNSEYYFTYFNSINNLTESLPATSFQDAFKITGIKSGN